MTTRLEGIYRRNKNISRPRAEAAPGAGTFAEYDALAPFSEVMVWIDPINRPQCKSKVTSRRFEMFLSEEENNRASWLV